MYENYSVLFVDDEANILTSLNRGLIDEEYDRFFASSGKQALEIMEKEKISVIVTDMRMPEMDGLTLLKIVQEKWPKTVPIVLSGYTQLQQILATINQVDIFKFITKPWKLEGEFKLVIYKALDYYMLHEENAKNKLLLEKKKHLYDNMLKSIDARIEKAKKGSEILGACGKAILVYSRDPKIADNEDFLDLRENIFDCFTKAVFDDEKEYDINSLESKISAAIESKIKISRVDSKVDNETKINTTFSILEAAILSGLWTFLDEFKSYTLFLNYGVTPTSPFAVSLIAPNAYASHNFINEDGLGLLNIKVDFINFVMASVLGMAKMTFYAKKINTSLVVTVSVNGA